MIKYIYFVFFIIANLYFSDGTLAYDGIITGRISLIMTDGLEVPARNVERINILNHSAKAKDIDSEGYFSLDLTNTDLDVGDKITLQIKCDGWSIYAPFNGEFFIPKEKDSLIEVKLISNNSEINVDNYTAKFYPENIYIVGAERKFYIQVFASKSIDKALKVRDSLVDLGFFNTFYKEFRSSSLQNPLDIYYKVIIGPFEKKHDAIKAKRQIKTYALFKESYILP